MAQNIGELFFERFLLILLAPLGGVVGAVAVQPARSDLGDEEGFSSAVRLILHPGIEIVEIFLDGRIVIPLGIDVVGDDVRKSKAEIGLELAARKGGGPRLVKRADDLKLGAIAFFSVPAVACALIEDPSDIDGGVVVVI